MLFLKTKGKKLPPVYLRMFEAWRRIRKKKKKKKRKKEKSQRILPH